MTLLVSGRRRALVRLAALPVLAVPLAAVPLGAAPATARSARVVTTWGSAPQQATPLDMAVTRLADTTVRNVVYTSVGGSSPRVRLSNAFGRRTVVVDRATIGVQLLGARLAPTSVHPVTFAGSPSVRLAAGAETVSDPVPMRVRPLTDTAVSLYVRGSTGPVTNHSLGQMTTYLARGDHAADVEGRAFSRTTSSWYLLSGLLVSNSTARGTVVAVGDSITDGYGSQVDANMRWPNVLARRLVRVAGERAPAVVNAGISGNRVLHDSACFGVNVQARFDRDVLAQPGVREVILLEGINDIGFSQISPGAGIPFGCFRPNTDVTAQNIIEGYRHVIARAHAHGLKIFGGTLTPFRPALYWSPAAEAKRETVNAWIRHSGAFDGVVDFARALADRRHPQYFNPTYDSGDHLHPNDAGYQRMGEEINLRPLLH